MTNINVSEHFLKFFTMELQYNKEALLGLNSWGRVYFLIRGFRGCAAGCCHIFMTGLTIMGLHFQ